MSKKAKKTMAEEVYGIGTLLAIPCDVTKGAVPYESFVSCNIEPIKIEGFMPLEMIDIEKGRVIAVVAERLSKEYISILFSGDIHSPGNPVKVPLGWVKDNCTIVPVK